MQNRRLWSDEVKIGIREKDLEEAPFLRQSAGCRRSESELQRAKGWRTYDLAPVRARFHGRRAERLRGGISRDSLDFPDEWRGQSLFDGMLIVIPSSAVLMQRIYLPYEQSPAGTGAIMNKAVNRSSQ